MLAVLVARRDDRERCELSVRHARGDVDGQRRGREGGAGADLVAAHDRERALHDSVAAAEAAVATGRGDHLVVALALVEHRDLTRGQRDRAPRDGRARVAGAVVHARCVATREDVTVGAIDDQCLGASEASDHHTIVGDDDVAQVRVEACGARSALAVGRQEHQLAAATRDDQPIARAIEADAPRHAAHGASRDVRVLDAARAWIEGEHLTRSAQHHVHATFSILDRTSRLAVRGLAQLERDARLAVRRDDHHAIGVGVRHEQALVAKREQRAAADRRRARVARHGSAVDARVEGRDGRRDLDHHRARIDGLARGHEPPDRERRRDHEPARACTTGAVEGT